MDAGRVNLDLEVIEFADTSLEEPDIEGSPIPPPVGRATRSEYLCPRFRRTNQWPGDLPNAEIAEQLIRIKLR